jgi:hypothetical protein
MTIYAINRYSSSRKPASSDPKASNVHLNIEADSPADALHRSGIPHHRPNFQDLQPTTLLLHWTATGSEIWVRPAIPGTKTC